MEIDHTKMQMYPAKYGRSGGIMGILCGKLTMKNEDLTNNHSAIVGIQFEYHGFNDIMMDYV
jgi:phage gpG-like protein